MLKEGSGDNVLPYARFLEWHSFCCSWFWMYNNFLKARKWLKMMNVPIYHWLEDLEKKIKKSTKLYEKPTLEHSDDRQIVTELVRQILHKRLNVSKLRVKMIHKTAITLKRTWNTFLWHQGTIPSRTRITHKYYHMLGNKSLHALKIESLHALKDPYISKHHGCYDDRMGTSSES